MKKWGIYSTGPFAPHVFLFLRSMPQVTPPCPLGIWTDSWDYEFCWRWSPAEMANTWWASVLASMEETPWPRFGLGVKCGKYLVKLVGYIVCILDCLECVSKENHLSAHSTQWHPWQEPADIRKFVMQLWRAPLRPQWTFGIWKSCPRSLQVAGRKLVWHLFWNRSIPQWQRRCQTIETNQLILEIFSQCISLKISVERTRIQSSIAFSDNYPSIQSWPVKSPWSRGKGKNQWWSTPKRLVWRWRSGSSRQVEWVTTSNSTSLWRKTPTNLSALQLSGGHGAPNFHI